MAENKDSIGRTPRQEPPPSSPPAVAVLADRLLDLVPDSTIYSGTVIQSKMKQAEYGDMGPQLVMFSRMIENDAHLWSIVQTRRLTVKKAERQILPPEGLEEDLKAATAIVYVEDVLSRLIGFNDSIPTMIDGPVRGFSALEILWDGPVPIALLDTPDYSWRWKSGTGLEYRAASGQWVEVPADKFLIHSPRNNSATLVRRGAMRAVAKWWLIKNIATRDWASFVELFGIPHRKLAYPTTVSGDDPIVQQVVSALGSMGASGIAAVRKDFELELMSPSNSNNGRTPHEELVRWCDAQMSKAILGQTLTVDTAQATGTYAAAQVHNEIRLDIAQADAEAIAERITEDLLVPMVGYGLGWDYPVPRLVLTIEDPVDEKSRAEVLKIASNDLGLPIALSTVYEELRIREPMEGEDLLEGPESVPDDSGDQGQGDDSETQGDDEGDGSVDEFRRQRRAEMLLASDDALGEVPLALEALALLSDREWREAESETIPEAISRMLKANPELGEDPDELLRRLGSWYADHPVEELVGHLERTMNGALVNAGLETDLEDEREGGEDAEVE